MRYIPSSALVNTSWYSFREDEIAKSKWYLPRLSDPCVLFPSETVDGKYHMFCHTYLGIHHYTSDSGLDWKETGRPLFLRAHFPYITKVGNVYYMFFERHNFNKKSDGVSKNYSLIYFSKSEDLFKWSPDAPVLDSRDVSLSSYRMGPCRISRPQVVEWMGRYILFFGSGEAKMFDSGQKTAVRFMAAESKFIEGPYKLRNKAVLEIEPDGPYRSLAAGAVRLFVCSDALCAVECSYVYDKENDRSRSLMLLLKSEDGYKFDTVKVMHTQAESGFSSRAITSCDLKYLESDDTWYCYFSANNRERYYPFVREGLGLLLGKSIEKD